ncbi:conserved hypothetical protein [Ricinus communis]|uniref:Uncharacterized protein n=1 Tax=Ricinus communis TaxID=3988 RepID=B9T4G0_RICCO|nr:conserved hypothetical protein [Ricinus communis]
MLRFKEIRIEEYRTCAANEVVDRLTKTSQQNSFHKNDSKKEEAKKKHKMDKSKIHDVVLVDESTRILKNLLNGKELCQRTRILHMASVRVVILNDESNKKG